MNLQHTNPCPAALRGGPSANAGGNSRMQHKWC